MAVKKSATKSSGSKHVEINPFGAGCMGLVLFLVVVGSVKLFF